MVSDEAAGTLVGLQETVVFEVFGVTVRGKVPADGALSMLPPYSAVRIVGPAVVGVNFTEHVLKDPCRESPQDPLENLPGLSLDQATVPVGVGLVPLTVASQVTLEPTTTEEVLHDNVRKVGGRGPTMTVVGV